MRIVQILIAPSDSHWQANMFGLSDNGDVYVQDGHGWSLAVPCIIRDSDEDTESEDDQ